MKAKDNDKGTYDPIPEDTHLGICVGVIDLGTQHNFKFNKYERKCLLSFELPEVRTEFEVEGELIDAPRFISRRFTLSLGSNAHLRKFLRTWRGRDFTPEELEGFLMKTLLGVGANVAVMHDTGKDGQIYSNIDSVSKLMKGQSVPDPETATTYFTFDDVETLREVDDAIDEMPEWIQKLIQKSVEYNDLANANAAINAPPEVPAGEVGATEPDDDIPF
jgi:hypothetical protein